MDYDHFMGEALEEAQKALARREFPVGCVMVCGGRIIARSHRQGTADTGRNELDHAEMIALRKWTRLKQMVHPVTVFCTMEPCLMCFSALILHRVREIVFAYEDAMGGGARCDRSSLSPLFRENQIVVHGGVRRSESLALFRAFFTDPAHGYWRGSFLAQYTLAQ
jgi:tRNA(adenine34) deaminase